MTDLPLSLAAVVVILGVLFTIACLIADTGGLEDDQ